MLLYWSIGQDILARQKKEGWGAQVVDRLSADLRAAFPDMKGFSPRNLKYMRAFAEAWPDRRFVQQVVARLPWGHNVQLLDGLRSATDRVWYARQRLPSSLAGSLPSVEQIEAELRRPARRG